MPDETLTTADPKTVAERLNKALQQYPDKDWAYSRITLVTKTLDDVSGPYVLRCEFVNRNDKTGRRELQAVHDEIQWGERHSAELGILEIISLRLNKALMEVFDPSSENGLQPVIRVTKKEPLREQGITTAFWYSVEEVGGEEFETR